MVDEGEQEEGQQGDPAPEVSTEELVELADSMLGSSSDIWGAHRLQRLPVKVSGLPPDFLTNKYSCTEMEVAARVGLHAKQNQFKLSLQLLEDIVTYRAEVLD